jgi:hypothetical protein
MRRIYRIALLAALVAVVPMLAGCEDFDMDKLDIFGLNQKKKLPGERKELFPGGVPGVTQGIPPEYLKGNQPSPETALAPSAEPTNTAVAADNKTTATASRTATAEQATEEKPKVKPKSKPKPRTASHPPTQITVQRSPPDQNAQQPLAPWPDQNQPQAPQGNQNQNATMAPWPSAPAPGTFSR